MRRDLDEVDRRIPVHHFQVPNLPGPKVIFDVAGKSHGNLPSGSIIRQILTVFIAMGSLPIDMEKVPRHFH
jgi:hypothetical protein